MGFYSILSALLLDPGGGLGFKYPLFGIGAFVGIVKFLVNSSYKIWWEDALFLFVIIIYALMSTFRGNEGYAIFDQISFIAFFLLLPILKGVGAYAIEKAIFRMVLACATLVITFFIIMLIQPDIKGLINQVATEGGLGYLGVKPGYMFIPNVYFRWSVLLLLGFTLALYKKKYTSLFVLSLSIIFTFSTALILGMIAIFFFYKCSTKQKPTNILLFIIIFIFAFIVAYRYNLLDFIFIKFTGINDPNSSSGTKILHIKSVFLLLHDPTYLLFGTGVGSAFYSLGAGKIVREIEVSQINVIRQYGLLFFIFFLIYIFKSIIRAYRCGIIGKGLSVAIVMIFLVAGTNPLLMSPMFFVPFLTTKMFSIEYMKEIQYGRYGIG